MSPFTTDASASIAALGEIALIDALRQWLGSACPQAPAGIGDDCAVVPPPAMGEQTLLTVDAVLWEKHFDATHAPELVGGKLLKRNLSDIAAMGGRPLGAVVALCMGPDVSQAWLKAFYHGLAEVSRRYDCPILGGDVCSDKQGRFGAFLTLYGAAAKPVLRRGAEHGSALYVTGALGGSIWGRHLGFEPRLNVGAFLAKRPEVCAMMDLSDGLGKDLPTLLGQSLSAALFPERIPIHADVARFGKPDQALEHALSDGEDYELLFALKPQSDTQVFEQAFAQSFPDLRLSKIGEACNRTQAPSPALMDAHTGAPLGGKGFDHFAQP